MVIAPSVGRSKPASSRISVLLPQPDGPIITVSLPRGTVNEQSRTTVLANFPAPYTFVTWLASIWAKVPATGCPIGAGGAGSRVSIPVLLLLAQPWRHHFAELAQECARHVAGDADADHSDDDLVVGAADVGAPDEEAEPAARCPAHRSGAAAARDHLGRHHHRPGDPDADRGADHDRGQRSRKDDATEDVP